MKLLKTLLASSALTSWTSHIENMSSWEVKFRLLDSPDLEPYDRIPKAYVLSLPGLNLYVESRKSTIRVSEYSVDMFQSRLIVLLFSKGYDIGKMIDC